ncbi:hypothetical protein LCGC14_1653640 [marine sediment metagenome]|uniref:Uncharacterized protein n=1 Tax=marine sediment metagenome TaxID=412755 RepID=A0A0F9HWV6_9ZZZZ|nr:MAG: hypothetical protein Lokiarch_13470 [Candidatus Lokiarchaeum sp. GC14_75]
MGKGGTVLGLIGIILGAGGLFFGFVAWNGQNNISSRSLVVGYGMDLRPIKIIQVGIKWVLGFLNLQIIK